MYARLLKRVEALLRTAVDTGASNNEREIALREALRVVSAARAGVVLVAEWRETTQPMQWLDCEECDDQIKPSERKFTNGVVYRHRECHASKA